MSKRCFVISPIGQPDSPEREHADDVFDYIIRPAMEELGIFVYRADHTTQMGRITDQMFGSILTDDLCIAILTGHNPNVFYELAIAQSAARPVIILIAKGETIPFDIRDLRAIEYDLKPRPLEKRVYSKQIIDHVRSLDSIEWKTTVPFGAHLTPLGNSNQRFRLHDSIESFGTFEKSLELLRKTTRHLDLCGLSLRWWTKLSELRRILLEKAASGCQIRLLQFHPDHPGLTGYINRDLANDNPERMRAQIASTFTFFTRLQSEQPAIQIRRIRNGSLHNPTSRFDQKMLVQIMLYSEATGRSPLLECGDDSPLYHTMLREFDAIWEHNPPESPELDRSTS